MLGSVIAVLAVAAAVGLIWWLRTNGTVRVSVSQARVQALLDSSLPLEGEKGPLRYRIESAAVALRPDGRVAMDMAVAAKLLAGTARGSLIGSGVIDYRDGGFYLSDIAIETVSLCEVVFGNEQPTTGAESLFRGLLQRVPSGVSSLLGDGAEAVGNKVKEWASVAVSAALKDRPIHTLDANDTKEALARLALRKVEVADGALTVTLDPVTAAGRLIALLAGGVMALICGVNIAVALATSTTYAVLMGVGAVLAFGSVAAKACTGRVDQPV